MLNLPYRRRRRGVSPIIADLLMVVIVVTAMTGVLMWVMTQVTTSPTREAPAERFIIEDVWFTNITGSSPSDMGNITIYVRNVGKVDVEIDLVMVNGTSKPFSVNGATVDNLLSLTVGEGNYIYVNSTWSSGSWYYIQMASKRGNEFAAMYNATTEWS